MEPQILSMKIKYQKDISMLKAFQKQLHPVLISTGDMKWGTQSQQLGPLPGRASVARNSVESKPHRFSQVLHDKQVFYVCITVKYVYGNNCSILVFDRQFYLEKTGFLSNRFNRNIFITNIRIFGNNL